MPTGQHLEQPDPVGRQGLGPAEHCGGLMLRDINKPTPRLHRGRREQRWAGGLGAHLRACRGIELPETEMAWSWGRGLRQQLPRGNGEAGKYSSPGIPCRWKAMCSHGTPEFLDTPKPWNWGCRKTKGGAGPGRMHFVPACDSPPRTQRLGNALHPVLDGVSCRKQPSRRQSPSLSPNPGHASCPHPAHLPWASAVCTV